MATQPDKKRAPVPRPRSTATSKAVAVQPSAAPVVLLTGFEPFGGESINPSWEAVRQLDGVTLAGARVLAQQLPCVFGQSLRVLERAIARHQPHIVICVGQAGGRVDITPERIAINVDDARIPDNAGKQPIDKPVVAKGQVAYFSTLPIKAMVAAMQQAGVPASVSNSAGTFVCNHVFYGLMAMQQRHGVARCGFIHIPYLPEQAAQQRGQPSMALDSIVQGLRVAVEVSVRTRRDARVGGGTIFG